jgi:hypothetical protein
MIRAHIIALIIAPTTSTLLVVAVHADADHIAIPLTLGMAVVDTVLEIKLSSFLVEARVTMASGDAADDSSSANVAAACLAGVFFTTHL